jgi:hypothetical protein
MGSPWRRYAGGGLLASATHLIATPSYRDWSMLQGRSDWQVAPRLGAQAEAGIYRELLPGWSLGLKAQLGLFHQQLTTQVRKPTRWASNQTPSGSFVWEPVAFDDFESVARASWLRLGLEAGVFRQTGPGQALYLGGGMGRAWLLASENVDARHSWAYTATVGYRWELKNPFRIRYVMPYVQRQSLETPHQEGVYLMRTLSVGVQIGGITF